MRGLDKDIALIVNFSSKGQRLRAADADIEEPALEVAAVVNSPNTARRFKPNTEVESVLVVRKHLAAEVPSDVPFDVVLCD